MERRTFIKSGVAGLGVLAVPGAVEALTTSSAKKNWAVLYGSSCGSTRTYAGYINEGMGGIADVVDIATTKPNPADYEYFVIGGWRSGSSIKPADIPDYISTNKAALKDKIKGFFVVLGNQGNPTLSTDMTTFMNTKLVQPSGITGKPAKILFGDNCNKTYTKNMNKTDGVDFGKLVIDSATAVLLDGSERSTRFSLFHSISARSSMVTISYSLPGSAAVEVTVNNLNGRRIATLVSSRQDAGSYSVKWNTKGVAPGVYLYRLETAGTAESRVVQLASY